MAKHKRSEPEDVSVVVEDPAFAVDEVAAPDTAAPEPTDGAAPSAEAVAELEATVEAAPEATSAPEDSAAEPEPEPTPTPEPAAKPTPLTLALAALAEPWGKAEHKRAVRGGEALAAELRARGFSVARVVPSLGPVDTWDVVVRRPTS